MHFSRVALSLCYTFFILHSFHVALFPCCNLSMLHLIRIALFSYLVISFSFYVFFALQPFHFALFSCCGLLIYCYSFHFSCFLWVSIFFTVFVFHVFRVEIFRVNFLHAGFLSCCPFSMLYSRHVLLFPSCTFSYCTPFMLLFFRVALLPCCFVLPSLYVELSLLLIFSCCTVIYKFFDNRFSVENFGVIECFWYVG